MVRYKVRISLTLLVAALAVGAAGCGGQRTSRRIDLVPQHTHARNGPDADSGTRANGDASPRVGHRPSPTPVPGVADHSDAARGDDS